MNPDLLLNIYGTGLVGVAAMLWRFPNLFP